MSTRYPRFKAAACHIASVFLDSARTVDKAVSWIGEAANQGAKLVVFPESFIPGFPVWAGLRSPIVNHDFFRALAREALTIDGPEIGRSGLLPGDTRFMFPSGLPRVLPQVSAASGTRTCSSVLMDLSSTSTVSSSRHSTRSSFGPMVMLEGYVSCRPTWGGWGF